LLLLPCELFPLPHVLAFMKLLVCLLLGILPVLAAPADLAGFWKLNLIRGGEEVSPARVELKVNVNKVTGTLNEISLEGTAEGDSLKLTATRPNGGSFGVLEGRLVGSDLKGTVRINDETVDWIMRRINTNTPPPQTRTFEPTEFHRLFSGTIPPALH